MSENSGSIVSEITSLKEEKSCFPCMPFFWRVVCFSIVCFIGASLSILSITGLITAIGGNPKTFTLGIILMLVSTLFLVDFKKQLGKMKEPVRLITSIILFGDLIALSLLIFLFNMNKPIITTPLVIVEIIAFVWYVLSYIPGAQDCFKSCCINLKNCCCSGQAGSNKEPLTA